AADAGGDHASGLPVGGSGRDAATSSRTVGRRDPVVVDVRVGKADAPTDGHLVVPGVVRVQPVGQIAGADPAQVDPPDMLSGALLLADPAGNALVEGVHVGRDGRVRGRDEAGDQYGHARVVGEDAGDEVFLGGGR